MWFLPLIKAIPGFIHTWRLFIMGGAILAAGITLFNYIDNHGEMKATIASSEETIKGQFIDIQALRIQIQKRDVRLMREREVKLAELEQARVRLAVAIELINELRADQERVQEELEVTRFETLEAIRDDEEMADWVDHTVPGVAWSLLRQAAEGRSGD